MLADNFAKIRTSAAHISNALSTKSYKEIKKHCDSIHRHLEEQDQYIVILNDWKTIHEYTNDTRGVLLEAYKLDFSLFLEQQKMNKESAFVDAKSDFNYYECLATKANRLLGDINRAEHYFARTSVAVTQSVASRKILIDDKETEWLTALRDSIAKLRKACKEVYENKNYNTARSFYLAAEKVVATIEAINNSADSKIKISLTPPLR